MPNGVETPTTGLIADNVIGFARALRVAGLPIGPGAVIDALNAMQLIDIGNRADLFTTLESIFVKRHEHALIFAQAFDLFFRRAEGMENMLELGAVTTRGAQAPATSIAPRAGSLRSKQERRISGGRGKEYPALGVRS